MAEDSAYEPLLLGENGRKFNYSKTTPLFLLSMKWVLKILMWVIFVFWVTLLFIYPLEFGNELFSKWINVTSHSLFGVTGWFADQSFYCS